MESPALAGSDFSGSNRIVAPSVPPEPSLLSNVPAACLRRAASGALSRPRTVAVPAEKRWSYHATRAAIGQALAFWLMSAIRISLLTAFSVM